MATSKTKADQKGTRKANETALKGFPKGKIRAAFEAMANARGAENEQAEARSQSALKVIDLAHQFREAQDSKVPTETIVQGWRDNLALVVMELAVAGNKFAELHEATKDKPARAKLTGYGNNVASIAKGLIQFELNPAETYVETRKAVEQARAEARYARDESLRELDEAKASVDEQWKELRKAVFGTDHTGLVNALRDLLTEAHADLMARPEAQSEEEEPTEENAQPDAEQAQAA